MREVMIAKRSLLAAMGASALLCAVPLSSAFAADAKGSPDEWIVELSNKILGDIRADAKLAQADPARVRKFVDEQIMPVVDFERMTRTQSVRSGVRPPRSSEKSLWSFSENS